MKHTTYRIIPRSASMAALLAVTSVCTSHGGELPARVATPTAAAPAPNPLSFAGGLMTFDFQERVRWEQRENNFDFNSSKGAVTDDNWGLQRLRLGLAVKPAPWFKLYVQGQDSREFQSTRPGIPAGAPSAEGDNAFDLRQAYVEIADYKKCPWGLKVGRQVLSYGDERLVGGFEWNNFARTFDAVKLTYKGSGFSLDAFSSSVVVPKAHEFDQSDVFNGSETGRGQVFSGVYLTVDPIPYGTLDLYVFQLDAQDGKVGPSGTSLPGSVKRSTDFTTLGTRVKGDPKKLGGWEYSGEFAYQTGRVQGLDLSAYAVSAGAGYNFEAPWSPRLYAEYNYASGDSQAGDQKVETFQNLFPTNHKFYGAMDVFSWQNLQNAMLSFRVSPAKTVTAQLDYNAFFAADTADGIYRANGFTKVAGTPKATSSTYEGSELDLVVTWNPKKYLQIQGGFCYFVPGNYIKSTGARSNAEMLYIQTTVNF